MSDLQTYSDEQLKKLAKQYIDALDPQDKLDCQMIHMIYGFTHTSFKNSQAQKGILHE